MNIIDGNADAISVLYVDDDPSLLDIGKRFLQRSGYFSIDTAISALDAMVKLSSCAYRCIISDYEMPEINGIQFLQSLRSDNNTIPFILFTGKGREEVVIEALNSGADFYLQKGGDPKSEFAELEYKIRLATGMRQMEGEIRESEKRYRDLFELNNAVMLIINPENGRILDANSAACLYYGYSRDEIRAMVIMDLNIADPKITWKYISSAAGANGAIFNFRHRKKSGEIRDVEVFSAPIMQSGYKILHSIIFDVTERKKSEDALIASEQRYRNVVEDQTEFISRFLPDGTHLFANEAYCRYFNKTRDDIIGKKFLPSIPKEDRKRVNDHFSSLARDCVSATIEHRIIMPDGEIRWHYWSDRAIFDKSGDILEYQSVGHDITDQKRAEHQLRTAHEQVTITEEELRQQYDELRKGADTLHESENLYRTIFENTGTAMVLLEEDTVISLANAEFEALSGYVREEIEGKKSWTEFVVKEDLDRMLAQHRMRRKSGEAASNHYEFRFVTRAGEVRHIYLTIDMIPETRRSVASLMDITALKQTEGSLRESETKYRDILENIQDGYYRSDLDGNLIMGSPSLTRLIGSDSLDECLGKKINETFYQDPAEREALLNEVREKGFVNNYEVTLKKMDGTPLIVSTSSHWYYDKSGAILGIEGIFRDISARKAAEAALEKSQREFEAIVQGSPIPTFVIDKDHRIISWNRAIEEYSGIPAGQMLGKKKAWQGFYQSDRPCLADLIVDAKPEEIEGYYPGIHTSSTLIEGAYEATDFFPHMKEGTWLFFTAAPIRDADGAIIGAVEILQDVTEKLKKEEELCAAYEEMESAFEEAKASEQMLVEQNQRLLDSEAFTRSLLDCLLDPVIIVRGDMDIRYVNRAGAECLNEGADNLTGQSILPYIMPKSQNLMSTDIMKILDCGLPVAGVYHLHTCTGTDLIVEGNGIRIDYQGSPAALIAFRDITARKLAEDELRASHEQLTAIEEELRQQFTELRKSEDSLRESENLYRTIFENTGTATVVLEEDTIISLVNTEFEALSGYSREEIEGKKSWVEFVVKEDLDAMAIQHQIRRKIDGAAFKHYEFRFITRKGTIRNISLTIDMISGTKRSIASLMDVTDKILEHDTLKRVTAKIGLVNSITRHDIINKLTGQFGYIEYAKNTDDESEREKCLQKIEEMAGVILEDLEFTRDYQEIGLKEPVWQDISQMVVLVQEQVDLKGAAIVADLDGVEVYGDSLLPKVIYNLLENSIHHGEHVARIQFRYKNHNDELHIIYEDDGVGIPADDKKRLFERGFGKHTGLGLFLISEILSITGITIIEDGVPGRGVRFGITIPKEAWRYTGVHGMDTVQ